MDRGTEIHEWIKARHASGMIVYAATALRVIKLKPKHASMVRSRNGHCEVQMGKRWDSINYCKLTAQEE